MDNVEQNLLDTAIENDFKIKRLYTLHKDLDKKIEILDNRPFLTEKEKLLMKKLKKEKLKGKDELHKLISHYQASQMS